MVYKVQSGAQGTKWCTRPPHTDEVVHKVACTGPHTHTHTQTDPNPRLAERQLWPTIMMKWMVHSYFEESGFPTHTTYPTKPNGKNRSYLTSENRQIYVLGYIVFFCNTASENCTFVYLHFGILTSYITVWFIRVVVPEFSNSVTHYFDVSEV